MREVACINCIHYKSQWFNPPICNRTQEIKRTFNPVTGWEEYIQHNTCEEEREEYSPVINPCGPDAKYYHAKF